MRRMRRWLALILAVVLLASNAVYQLSTNIDASEVTEMAAESTEQQEQTADVPVQVENVGGVSIQEVIPEPVPEEVVPEEVQPVEPEQVQAPESQPEEEPEAADDSAASKDDTSAEEPEEKTYKVRINSPNVDGGSVTAWTDGGRESVPYGGGYVKEVKENGTFNFEIAAKDTYEVETVTDQNGSVAAPASVNGKVYTYTVGNITSDRSFSIVYKEVKTESEKSDVTEEKPKDEEKTEEKDQEKTDGASTEEETGKLTDGENELGQADADVLQKDSSKKNFFDTIGFSFFSSKKQDNGDINENGIKIAPDSKPSDFNYGEIIKGSADKGGTVKIGVGETGAYQAAPTAQTVCPECGHILGTYTPQAYCGINYMLSKNIIKMNSESVGSSNGSSGLQANFEALEKGQTTVLMNYNCNYLIEGYSGKCPECGKDIKIAEDKNWYADTSSFTVEVTDAEEEEPEKKEEDALSEESDPIPNNINVTFDGIEGIPTGYKIDVVIMGAGGTERKCEFSGADGKLSGIDGKNNVYRWIYDTFAGDEKVTITQSGMEVEGYTVSTSSQEKVLEIGDGWKGEDYYFKNTYTKESKPATTKQTLTKTFTGISEGEIPDGFTIKVEVDGAQHGKLGDQFLTQGNAAVTTNGNNVVYTWEFDTFYEDVAETNKVSDITFTEEKADVDGYTRTASSRTLSQSGDTFTTKLDFNKNGVYDITNSYERKIEPYSHLIVETRSSVPAGDEVRLG